MNSVVAESEYRRSVVEENAATKLATSLVSEPSQTLSVGGIHPRASSPPPRERLDDPSLYSVIEERLDDPSLYSVIDGPSVKGEPCSCPCEDREGVVEKGSEVEEGHCAINHGLTPMPRSEKENS